MRKDVRLGCANDSNATEMSAGRIRPSGELSSIATMVALVCSAAVLGAATNAVGSAAGAPGSSTDKPLSEAVAKAGDEGREEWWNWHVQNTDIVQGYPGFPAKYSGPNSLPSGGEVRETVSLDLYAGVRLWCGAEAHVDGLMWQETQQGT
jgi:high affinity Mn2+ porin